MNLDLVLQRFFQAICRRRDWKTLQRSVTTSLMYSKQELQIPRLGSKTKTSFEAEARFAKTRNHHSLFIYKGKFCCL